MKQLAPLLVLTLVLIIAFASSETVKASAFNENLTISLSGDYNKAISAAKPWMNPILTQEEIKAIEWVKQNTPERTVFMSDIFGGELLMANLREGVEGGDWAIIPNVIERMDDVQHNFYEAETVETAWNTAKKYGAEFVWAPNRQVFAGYAWVNIPSFLEESEYFEKVFDNGARVYKVK
ncbi:MAG: hypothetical protein ABH803_03655 [Candidatus Micrarchaeota archaeon]